MFLTDTDVLSMLRRRERSPAIARWVAKQRTELAEEDRIALGGGGV